MQAIIRVDVPDWQIGQKVSVYFPDSMVLNSICEIDNTDDQFKMRDATEEERKSIYDYVRSISKPTGIQFDEVAEELNFVQEHPKIRTKLKINNVANMEFPTIDKFAKEVAEKALDEITYEGKTIREWAEIITKLEQRWR